MHSINQSNQNGNNQVNIYIGTISIDIGYLQDIVFSDPERLTGLLNKITDSKERDMPQSSNSVMEDIDDKNKKNDLVEYYEQFIQHEESKFQILEEFIKENELAEKVDIASGVIKRAIFSYENRKSSKLTPEIFDMIVTEFTKSVQELENKELMKLWIYFLYRYCFIGEK